MHRALLVAGLSAFLLIGCAHRAECRLHGGTEWHEVSSAHFKVRTDAPLDEVRAEVVRLESLRTVLYQVLDAEGADVPDQLSVTLLDSEDEMHEFTEYEGFMRREAGFMALARDTHATGNRNWTPGSRALHELAHDVAGHVLLRNSRWLGEGLALYLETIQLPTDGEARAIVGRENSSMLWHVRNEPLATLEDLWNWERAGKEDRDTINRVSAASWAWVHFLMNRHYDQFHAWLRKLSEGSDPKVTFDAVFGADHRSLEHELTEYLASGAYNSFTYPIAVTSVAMTTTDLHPALVHLMRAQLSSTAVFPNEGSKARYDQDLAQAVALGPDVFEVQAGQVRTTKLPEREAPARRLVAAFPNEAEAHHVLATAVSSPEERFSELRRASELGQNDGVVLNQLAWELILRGNADEALPAAQRALHLAPWSSDRADTVAVAFAARGECESAAKMEQRAKELLSESASEDLRKELTRRLEEFSRPNCRDALSAALSREVVKRRRESAATASTTAP